MDRSALHTTLFFHPFRAFPDEPTAGGGQLRAGLFRTPFTACAMDTKQLLEAGCEILDPILVPQGFTRSPVVSGRGSGGHFSSCAYTKGNRRLELHFRYSLGLVSYHVGSAHASHEAYMAAVLGPGDESQYPGFSQDPLDGFRHLANDLGNFAHDFLEGDAEHLREAASEAGQKRLAEQQAFMAKSTGDQKRRAAARDLFRRKDYAGVVEQLGQLRYPELMSASEETMLRIALKRLGRGGD